MPSDHPGHPGGHCIRLAPGRPVPVWKDRDCVDDATGMFLALPPPGVVVP